MTTPFQATQTFLFSPLSLSNCTLWLDASDPSTLFQNTAGTNFVTANGQSVAYWKDKSSSGNNATNATNPPTILTASQNNKSVINFGGSQYLNLDVTKMPTGAATYSFFVLTKTTTAATGVFLSWGATTAAGKAPQFFFGNYLLNNDLYGSNGPADTTTYNNTYVLNTAVLTPSLYSSWDNGNPFSTTDVAVANLNLGSSFAYIGTGQLSGSLYAPFYYNGQIAEIVGYNRQLNATERQQIEAYLLWKWGLQGNLPASNPNKTSPVYALQPFPLVPQVPYGTNSLPFDPRSISGCQLWLDAADRATILLSGNNVTQWNDKSGNNRNATATGTIPYTATINGVPALSFLGNVSTYLRGSLTNTGPTITGFAVFVMNASSQNNVRILSVASPGQADYNSLSTAQIVGRDTIGYHVVRNLVGSAVSATFGIPALTSSLFTDSNMTIFLNGTAGTTSATSGNFGYSEYTLGSSPTEENLVWLNGSIGEIVMYHSALTTAQRQQIEGYLAWKWGLTANLPSGHPYKVPPLAPFSYGVRQVTQSSSWSPLNITGSVLWLDAKSPSSITPSTGGTVTAITDKSAAVKSISVVNTVTYTVNTALVFTDTNGRLNPALMPAAPYDYIFVGTANSSSATWRTMLRTGGGPGTHPFLLQSGTDNAGMWDGITGGTGAFYQFGSLTQTPNEKAMFYGSMATNQTITASKNGTVALTSASPAGNESVITVVGNSSVGAQPYGQLHELIIYSQTLSLSQRQQVEGYLAWKWGIQSSLPLNHPFKFFPPPPS